MSRVVPKQITQRVQSRANFMCEYCKLPDSLGFANFEVDHIIARAHGGGDQLENLAWSCLLCNVNKGPNIASIDSLTGETTPLFHPRTNVWQRHFRLSEGLVIPRTASGRATLFLLKMNSPQTFGLRRALEEIDADYVHRAARRCV